MAQYGETILFESIVTQLTATSGWATTKLGKAKNPYGNTPSYQLFHTRTLYHGTPYPSTCTIEFDLVLNMPAAPFTNNAVDLLSSQVDGNVLAFFSGGYTPPPVTTGDDLQVNSVSLVSRDHHLAGDFEFSAVLRTEATRQRNVQSRQLRIYHMVAQCTFI